MGRYIVYLTPRAIADIKELPGNIKQRVKREVSSLADHARPSNSIALKITEAEYELRRIRLERWRIVYSVVERGMIIDILTVRKRPPYNYEDLENLIRELK
jgi:mRNA interferase RelE/StbE